MVSLAGSVEWMWMESGTPDSAWAATTKYYSPRDQNKRKVFPHTPGGWKSKTKVRAGWALLWPLSLACEQPHFPCVYAWSSLCAHTCHFPVCPDMSLQVGFNTGNTPPYLSSWRKRKHLCIQYLSYRGDSPSPHSYFSPVQLQ